MESWVGTLLALGLGIVYVALGYPLYRRTVGPNSFYGFRLTFGIPSTSAPANISS